MYIIFHFLPRLGGVRESQLQNQPPDRRNQNELSILEKATRVCIRGRADSLCPQGRTHDRISPACRCCFFFHFMYIASEDWWLFLLLPGSSLRGICRAWMEYHQSLGPAVLPGSGNVGFGQPGALTGSFWFSFFNIQFSTRLLPEIKALC